MQYLSQRLAVESTGAGRAAPRGPSPATQRERILAATEQLIAEKGCAGTTIEAIVKEAGVSSVTFYELFEGKEECFVAAFDRAVEGLRAELRDAAPAELPWPERVQAGLAALLAALDADPARARLCLVEAQKGGPQLRARYEAALDAVGGRALRPARPGDRRRARLAAAGAARAGRGRGACRTSAEDDRDRPRPLPRPWLTRREQPELAAGKIRLPPGPPRPAARLRRREPARAAAQRRRRGGRRARLQRDHDRHASPRRRRSPAAPSTSTSRARRTASSPPTR